MSSNQFSKASLYFNAGRGWIIEFGSDREREREGEIGPGSLLIALAVGRTPSCLWPKVSNCSLFTVEKFEGISHDCAVVGYTPAALSRDSRCRNEKESLTLSRSYNFTISALSAYGRGTLFPVRDVTAGLAKPQMRRLGLTLNLLG